MSDAPTSLGGSLLVQRVRLTEPRAAEATRPVVRSTSSLKVSIDRHRSCEKRIATPSARRAVGCRAGGRSDALS